MAQYKTPNVYVKEESTLPPSVAEVATAIPAFIGFTEITEDAKDKAISLVNMPIRITSLDEYEAVFGGAYAENIKISYSAAGEFYVPEKEETALSEYFLYQSVQHFFANGGGACYVVSVGMYGDTKEKSIFMDGLMALEAVDEVTLFVMPETVTLPAQSHYDVHNAAIAQANKLQDRFAIIDVQQINVLSGDTRADAELMRNKVVGELKYGAAYYPYLRTSIARSYSEDTAMVTFKVLANKIHSSYSLVNLEGTALDDEGYAADDSGPYRVFVSDGAGVTTDLDGYKVDLDGERELDGAGEMLSVAIFENADGDAITMGDGSAIVTGEKEITVSLAYLNNPITRFSSTAQYNSIKSLLRSNYLILPPSAGVVGGIAKTDGSRGVWKSPANVPLTQVLAPVVMIDNSQQESLNVDETAGKSINAIRAFVGKGNLIWGARTLAGNDLEWRYISVRRLFNMVEESLKKATAFAVFEPNTPFTWLKLKTMTENYLRNLWQQGALMGASESQAFFVNVGLGESMTEQDILEGLMKIKIGMAASRPAEFIELTFQHKSLEG